MRLDQRFLSRPLRFIIQHHSGQLRASSRIEVDVAWPGPRQQVISEYQSCWEKMITEGRRWPLAQHVCRTG
jgi:hypothetical protein